MLMGFCERAILVHMSAIYINDKAASPWAMRVLGLLAYTKGRSVMRMPSVNAMQPARHAREGDV